MAYSRRTVSDNVTIMNKDLYDNLQDGVEEAKSLKTNIDKEATTRANADTAINTKLDAIKQLSDLFYLDTPTGAKGDANINGQFINYFGRIKHGDTDINGEAFPISNIDDQDWVKRAVRILTKRMIDKQNGRGVAYCMGWFAPGTTWCILGSCVANTSSTNSEGDPIYSNFIAFSYGAQSVRLFGTSNYIWKFDTLPLTSTVNTLINNAKTALETAYKNADTTLSTNLTNAYKNADSTLSTNLTNAYIKADSVVKETLQKAITNGDTTLQTAIDTLSSRLMQVVQRDISSVKFLPTKKYTEIGTTDNINEAYLKIIDEWIRKTYNSTNADLLCIGTVVSKNDGILTYIQSTADGISGGKEVSLILITKNTTYYLNTKINTSGGKTYEYTDTNSVVSNAITTAVNNKATEVKNTLQTNINNEATARANGDSNLQTNINTLTNRLNNISISDGNPYIVLSAPFEVPGGCGGKGIHDGVNNVRNTFAGYAKGIYPDTQQTKTFVFTAHIGYVGIAKVTALIYQWDKVEAYKFDIGGGASISGAVVWLIKQNASSAWYRNLDMTNARFQQTWIQSSENRNILDYIGVYGPSINGWTGHFTDGPAGVGQLFSYTFYGHHGIHGSSTSRYFNIIRMTVLATTAAGTQVSGAILGKTYVREIYQDTWNGSWRNIG